MNDFEKVAWIMFNNENVPFKCNECPLNEAEVAGEPYCMNDCSGPSKLGAKSWLFDNFFDKGNLVGHQANNTVVDFKTDPYTSGKMKMPSKNKPMALPDGLLELSVDKFRDGMRVRVFAKEGRSGVLNEVGDGMALVRTKGPGGGMCWQLISDATIQGNGFVDNRRTIANDQVGMLTDVLIVACTEEVLNPKAHLKRNYRRLKT